MSDRMGLGPEEKLHECDGCGATVFASDSELKSLWRWVNHTGTRLGRTWSLLLCRECEERAKQKAAA